MEDSFIVYNAKAALGCLLYALCYSLFCWVIGAPQPPLYVPLWAEEAVEHAEEVHPPSEPERPDTRAEVLGSSAAWGRRTEQAARDASNAALEGGACSFCD